MQLSRKNVFFILLSVVLAGLILRLLGVYWGHGYYQTGIADDMEAFRSALNYLEGEAKAQYLGQPNFNSGHVPGPLWAMLWSLPLRFGGSPPAVILLLVLLNAATIPLVYLLARRLFGLPCALWATLFYSVSPWPIYFSISCNNPSVMAMLGVLLFLALWDVCSKPGSPHIFWVCLLLAAIPQFHMIGVFYAPFVLLVILLSGSRINRKWLAVGVLAAAAIYLPYINGELHNHWENTRQILGGTSRFRFGVLKILTAQVNVFSNLISRWTGHRLAEYRAFGDAAMGSFYVLAGFNVISVVLGTLALGDFIREIFRPLKGRRLPILDMYRSSQSLYFTGILLFGPLLFFVLTGHDFATRYLYVQFPLLFCLPALFLVKISKPGKWRTVLAGSMVVTTVFNLVLTPLFFRYQKMQIENAAVFVPTFPRMETLYRLLRTDAPPDARILIWRKDTSAAEEIPINDAAFAITQYVVMRDELFFLGNKFRQSRFYLLEPTAVPRRTGDRAVFEGNGIRITRQAPYQ